MSISFSEPEIESRRRALVQRIESLGALPVVARRALELADDPDTSLAELESLIASDPALSARLLRVVNSAFYGLPGQVGSLRQAVILLGFQQVRALILSSAFGDLFVVRSPARAALHHRLWVRAIAASLLAEAFARPLHLAPQAADLAPTAALLADIGRLLLLVCADDEFVPVGFPSEPSPREVEVEREFLGMDHAECGGRMAQAWNFPALLADLIRSHEEPVADHPDPLWRSVRFAHDLARTLACPSDAALDGLGLDPELVAWAEGEGLESLERLAEVRLRVETLGERFFGFVP